MPSEFLARLKTLGVYFHTLDMRTLVLAAMSLAVILLVPKLFPRLPGSIVALVLATGAVMIFGIPVATIGSKFGGIPAGLPVFDIPKFRRTSFSRSCLRLSLSRSLRQSRAFCPQLSPTP